MRRLLAILAALLLVPGVALGQNVAPRFSHGPSLPFYTVEFDSSGGAHSGFLTAGAGYSLTWNFKPNASGTVRMLNVGVPFYMSFTGDQARLVLGGTVGIWNNLFAVGPALRVLDAAEGAAPRGLADGLDREDLMILIAFGFNLGAGQPPPASKVSSLWRGLGGPTPEPPPNYVRLW